MKWEDFSWGDTANIGNLFFCMSVKLPFKVNAFSFKSLLINPDKNYFKQMFTSMKIWSNASTYHALV